MWWHIAIHFKNTNVAYGDAGRVYHYEAVVLTSDMRVPGESVYNQYDVRAAKSDTLEDDYGTARNQIQETALLLPARPLCAARY
eukprot:3022605-Rhodomonas_salina.3